MSHLAHSVGGANRSMRELVEAIEPLGVSFTALALRGGIIRSLVQLVGLVKRVAESDLVLYNGSAAVVRTDPRPVMWICRLFRVPVVVYVRESGFQYANKYPVDGDDARGGRLWRVYSSRRVRFLFVSEFALESFAKYFGPPVNGAVVGNGIHIPQYVQTFERIIPKQNLPLVINIGTLQDRKDFRLFIQIATNVCRDHPDALFIWLGNGPELELARSMADETGFRDRIVFPGFVQDPFPLLWLSRLVLVTSKEESFSRVAAEALALGKELVVCEGVGGPEEITGPFAHRVDRSDPAAAADVVNRIIVMEEIESACRERRRHFSENYSMEVHARRFAEVLKSVLA